MSNQTTPSLPLTLGYSNRKENPVYLSLASRLNHSLFYGKNIYGKNSVFLKLIEEELKNKGLGLTIIVDTEYLGSEVFTLAKEAKRQVKWLSPSVDVSVKRQLLWEKEYREEMLDEMVLDYERAIRSGSVVILDLEPYKYFEHYDQAVRLLLFHLQTKLVKMKKTERKPHLIYVEDGRRHLPALDFFFEQGPAYQCGVMMWVDSFRDLAIRFPKSQVYLETHICNNFLYSKLAPSDFEHFKLQFPTINDTILRERPGRSMFYSLLNQESGRFNQGLLSMYRFDDVELEQLRERAKRRYLMAVKALAKKENEIDAQLETEEQAAAEPVDEVTHLLDEMVSARHKVKVIPQHKERKPLEIIRANNFKHLQTLEVADLPSPDEVANWPDI